MDQVQIDRHEPYLCPYCDAYCCFMCGLCPQCEDCDCKEEIECE